MYNGWNDNGCHSQDWVHNTNAFLDHAFSADPNAEKRGVGWIYTRERESPRSRCLSPSSLGPLGPIDDVGDVRMPSPGAVGDVRSDRGIRGSPTHRA